MSSCFAATSSLELHRQILSTTHPAATAAAAAAAAAAAGGGEEDRGIGNSRESVIRVQTPDGRRIGVRPARGRRRLGGGGHDDDNTFGRDGKSLFPKWYIYNLSLSLAGLFFERGWDNIIISCRQ